MNRGLEPGFISVTVEQFQKIVDTFNYARKAWGDFIEYFDRDTGLLFGMEGTKKYYLHPELVEESK